MKDQDIGENDSEEDFHFLPAERRVITQPLDLSVQTLVEQWKNNQLVLPDIQREYVWDNAKASRLIEFPTPEHPYPRPVLRRNRGSKVRNLRRPPTCHVYRPLFQRNLPFKRASGSAGISFDEIHRIAGA